VQGNTLHIYIIYGRFSITKFPIAAFLYTNSVLAKYAASVEGTVAAKIRRGTERHDALSV